MLARPRLPSLALMLATVTGGLAIRFAPLGLPPFLVKYGGSALWALMIYWIISTLLSSWRLYSAALLAGLAATLVELFKLYQSPALDAYRLTLPGKLLLGRHFSFRDIVAYWAAIAAGVALDRSIRRPDQFGESTYEENGADERS